MPIARFLPVCRDLSRLQLSSGSAAFLLGLTQLTTLRLAGTQVGSCLPRYRAQGDSARNPHNKTVASRLHFYITYPSPLLHGLPCLQMRADQFGGLSSLVALAELDVSSTGFDDACCGELAPLAGLTSLK